MGHRTRDRDHGVAVRDRIFNVQSAPLVPKTIAPSEDENQRNIFNGGGNGKLKLDINDNAGGTDVSFKYPDSGH
jgi:hypothetical protein